MSAILLLFVVTFFKKQQVNKAEQSRLREAGAQLAPVGFHLQGPAKPQEMGVGPLRMWPGGLCVSRWVVISVTLGGAVSIQRSYTHSLSVPAPPSCFPASWHILLLTHTQSFLFMHSLSVNLTH